MEGGGEGVVGRGDLGFPISGLGTVGDGIGIFGAGVERGALRGTGGGEVSWINFRIPAPGEGRFLSRDARYRGGPRGGGAGRASTVFCC